jgi:predicted DNA-binding transcriptional regulator AlpA
MDSHSTALPGSLTTVTPGPAVAPEILNVADVAELLRMSRSQIYTLTRRRALRNSHPIPVIRLSGNLRFRRASVLAWLSQIETVSVGVTPVRSTQ